MQSFERQCMPAPPFVGVIFAILNILQDALI